MPESLIAEGFLVFMTYKEKLLDPRWQKLRLEILERDNWTCQLCFDKDTTLHVHHHYYPESKNPWDSTPLSLVTYCKHCHALVETGITKYDHICNIIKSKRIPDITVIAVFTVLYDNLFSIYHFDELENKITYITCYNEVFATDINNYFSKIKNVKNG